MSDWFEIALNRRREAEKRGEEYSYAQIALDFGIHYDTVRKRFKKELAPNIIVPSTPEIIIPEIDLTKKTLELLGKGVTLESLSNQLKVSVNVSKALVEDLKCDGYQISQIGGVIKLIKDIIPQEFNYSLHWDGSKVFRFGVVSDTHMCSNFQQLTHLNTIYDLFEKEGIEKVFHVGDVIEGINMRKGHEFEIFKHGADAQTMYVVENYPYRKSISTDFILGNHDSTAIKEAGHNIGITLDRQRPDMNYLGVLNARVSLTPNCVVELNHPLDGMAYALSYPIQKSIESMIQMDVDDRPQIFLNGHHHKAIYVYTYGVHALECGTFQSRTAWMKGKRIPAMMGGYIVTVHVNSDGSVSRFIPEFIPAGKTIINDY